MALTRIKYSREASSNDSNLWATSDGLHVAITRIVPDSVFDGKNAEHAGPSDGMPAT